MASFLIIDFSLFAVVKIMPVQEMTTPIIKFDSLSTSKLKDISKSDSPPLTISIYHSLLTRTQFSYFS